jgi:probable HAF family extracellular repeat protein
MKRTNLLCKAVLPLILSGALAVPLAANAQTFPPARNYEVHALTLNGAGCRVSDIDAGMAVGWCGNEAPRRAFAWTEATGMIDLGTLGGTTALAFGTRNGRAVGSSTLSGDLTENAMAWSLSTGMIDLGSLGGGSWMQADATAGNVVVGSGSVNDQPRAFRWTPSTGLVALPGLPGSTESVALDVDGSLIAGYSGTSVPGRRPVAWRTDGTLIDPIGAPIESCGIFVCGTGESTAVRDGLVVGYSSDVADPERIRAFAWSEAGGLVDLGLVAGATDSFAFDTDDGAVVGQLSGPFPLLTIRAFIWTAAAGMRAITPDTVSAVATSITNGRVVGWYGSADTNGTRPFLWTPRRGPVDVTPPGFNGSRPMGIDAAGRIAVLYEDENPANTKSVVLVPRRP